MIELIGDESKRQQLRTRARQRALRVFRVRDTADGLLRHYDALG